ncbi:MAG: TusE/DsrC/DsvC family sulfur relay protein [Ignavibacteria bacterium]|jgi:tRNA 2-thiouridine synthesizing protein E|nr:TusE/DsrC/DsvC family sulfur relay protein [Ignavibacteria bacterium]MDH7526955.1 TusE/DsrC/DsvC family sulfur relay protein [Ignavibacteria bacterium]
MPTREILGKMIEFDDDGHLKNLSDWNEDIARELAKEEGIPELTERHWLVINYMRQEFQKVGDAPSIRKLTKESGVDTKELYQLFPKGPAKKASKIAGLPKPKGCI